MPRTYSRAKQPANNRKLMTTPGKELLFLALGGSGEIGMNVNLYGCDGKWVMVDLGLTFADPAYPGIDLILPDLDFIEKNRDNLLGIVLTHGHEDHIGAIPYLWPQLQCPIWATPFTASLLRAKLDEAGLAGKVPITLSVSGTRMAMRGSIAVFPTNASSERLIPGAMMPPL